MFNRFRILMNEQDGSPGNGAPPVQTPAPAPTGAAPAPAFSMDDIKAAVRATVADEFKAQSNGLFASARKAGLLKPESPAAEPVAPTPPPQPNSPPPASVSMEDVEAMLERERVIATRSAKYELTEAQSKRMKSALRDVAPGQVAAEADAFLSDLGLVKAQTATAFQQAAPAPAAPAAAIPNPANNITDRGPATAGDVRDVETLVQSRPLEMTSSDFERLRVKVGREKALAIVQESVNSHLRTIRLTPDRRR